MPGGAYFIVRFEAHGDPEKRQKLPQHGDRIALCIVSGKSHRLSSQTVKSSICRRLGPALARVGKRDYLGVFGDDLTVGIGPISFLFEGSGGSFEVSFVL